MVLSLFQRPSVSFQVHFKRYHEVYYPYMNFLKNPFLKGSSCINALGRSGFGGGIIKFASLFLLEFDPVSSSGFLILSLLMLGISFSFLE